jgi:hypothetical protein
MLRLLCPAPGASRRSVVVALALVVAMALPAPWIVARQADEAAAPRAQESQPEPGEQAPQDSQAVSETTDPAAPPGEEQEEIDLPGETGIPAPDPGPVLPLPPPPPPPPPPTLTPTLTPHPTVTVTPTPRDLTMRVELDVYSGRPNPAWDITSEEGEQLLATFRELPARATGTLPGSLGYRGVILQGGGVRAAGYERITIRNRVVLAEGPLGNKLFSDSDRAFEGQAAATGQGKVDLSEFTRLLPSPTPVPREFRPPPRPFERF